MPDTKRILVYYEGDDDKVVLEGLQPLTLTARESGKGRVILFSIAAADRSGQVTLVPVGLQEDPDLRNTYGIERFAVDDHILRLVRDQRVYATVSELESAPHELAMRKMAEVADLLRENGLAIQQSKRFLHILRAVAAVRPSSAVFVERLMKKAGDTLSTQELRAIFSPQRGKTVSLSAS